MLPAVDEVCLGRIGGIVVGRGCMTEIDYSSRAYLPIYAKELSGFLVAPPSVLRAYWKKL